MFKKILASALAVAMLAGMSVTAFADPDPNMFNEMKKGDLFFYFAIMGPEYLERGEAWFMIDDENQVITADDNIVRANFDAIKPGDRIATPILRIAEEYGDATSYEDLIDFSVTSDEIRGWNLDILWDTEDPNMDIIEGVYFQTVRRSILDDGQTSSHMVVIEFSDDVAEIDMNDLVGRLVMYERSKTNILDSLQTMQLNGNHFATVGYESIGYDDAGFHDITSTGAPVRDFTDANMNEITELYFDGVGIFYTANIGDEGAKYLGFNMNPDYELLAQYPTADMEFINFPGMVKFNRFGTFELFKQENQFAYAVVDGEIVTLESIARNGKVVDGIDEGYSLVLSIKNFPESFILSDTELELTEAVEDEEVVEDAVDAEPAA